MLFRSQKPRDAGSVLAAERGIVQGRFGGSRSRYLAGLRSSRLTVLDARALIADRLARDAVEARFRPRRAPRPQVDDFLLTYAGQSVRLVEATPDAPWLGDVARGWAISTLAPAAVFTIPVGRKVKIDTPDGRFTVRALGPPMPLELLPRAKADAAARAALDRLAKQDLYGSWLEHAERSVLADAVCVRDQLPNTGRVDLASLVPFLAD